VIRGLRNSDGKLIELSIWSIGAIAGITAAGAGGKKKTRKNGSSAPKVQMESLVFVVNEVED